jgi:hypothetical protein
MARIGSPGGRTASAGAEVAALPGAPSTATASASPSASPACCAVVELRQYTVYPGKRDTLIALFEDRFIESQEDVGIHVLAQFRDVNDANRFVWIRGFDTMEARRQALTGFYAGTVWQAHRNQANATLYDNDDVLLLHPATPGSGLVVATIYYFEHRVPDAFVARFERELLPLFESSGARVLARYVSEKSRNTFERLPVREQDNVFVWLAGFADRQAYDDYTAALARDERWSGEWFAAVHRALQRPPDTLMLHPTPRSLVGH